MPLIERPATGPHATVLARTRLRPAEAMTRIADVPVPAVFTGRGPFPAVTRVEGQVGAWDRIGATRTAHLGDGGTVQETIVAWVDGAGFAYELLGFTDAFARLVHGVRGEWTFMPDGDGTLVRWTWEFHARRGMRGVVRAVVAPAYAAYMRRVIAASVRAAEDEAAPAPA